MRMHSSLETLGNAYTLPGFGLFLPTSSLLLFFIQIDNKDHRSSELGKVIDGALGSRSQHDIVEAPHLLNPDPLSVLLI